MKQQLRLFTRWRHWSRVVMMLLCSVLTLPSIAESLTVYDGTVLSYYAPAYIYYWDDYARSECVIPASALEDMVGGTITALTFYTNQTSALNTTAAGDFYLKEVNYTSISTYETKNNCTIVYSGKLAITSNGQTTITLNQPFTYNGGNLLIGSENQTDAGYNAVRFYGQTVNGACIAGSNYSNASAAPATQQNFIPKTTFTYELPTAYPKPTNVAVDDITARSAKVTWDGDANALSYNLRYREVGGLVTTFFDDFENGLGNWTIYTDGEAPNTNGWYQYNPTNGLEFDAVSGSYVASAWSWASTAYDADNWLITPQVTFDKKLKFWVRTNSGFPDEYAVLLSTTGNAESDFTVTLKAMATAPAVADWTQITIDLSAYENQTGYIAIHHVSNDCNYLLIDDFSIGHETTTGEWIPVSPAVSPQDITGLNPSTEYEVQVQAVYADDNSDWTNSVNFTTASADAMPFDLTVTDVTDCSAKATWLGSQDSYNLRYRKMTFFESFETFPGDWTIVDSDGDGYIWSQTDLTTQFSGSYTAVDGNNVVMSRSWINSTVGAVNPDQWLISPQVELGGMLKYFVMDELTFPETYRIYVSTTGTDISDFEPLTDDLLTPNNNKWTECTVDLSAYNGVPGYIAFRHYNSYDQSFMFIDALSIGDNWTTVNNVTSPKTIEGLDPESDYEVEVQGVFDNGTTNWTLPAYFTTDEVQVHNVSLAQLVDEGVKNGTYNVIEADAAGLLCVKVVPQEGNKAKLFCKDNGHYDQNNMDVLGDDENDYMGGWDQYDQSNWIVLNVSNVTSDDPAAWEGYMINGIQGKLDNKENPEMTLDGKPTSVGDYIGYEPNTYIVPSFYGTQLGTGDYASETYFFVKPKPMEYVFVKWAQWDGSKFVIPTGENANAYGLTGSFGVDWSFMDNPGLDEDAVYQMKGVAMLNTSKAGNFKVSPTEITDDSQVITGVNEVARDGAVEVARYNVAGMRVDSSYRGVVIVVMSDGSAHKAVVK